MQARGICCLSAASSFGISELLSSNKLAACNIMEACLALFWTELPAAFGFPELARLRFHKTVRGQLPWIRAA